MSGFEFLSVVRRPFPQIPVIAMSGAYQEGSAVPGGVIADGFYSKGSHPEAFLRTVADLIRTSAAREAAHRKESAPVWIPRNGKDSNGVPYIVLTCTECLRSFPLSVREEGRSHTRSSKNALSLLRKYGEVHHRFLAFSSFSSSTPGHWFGCRKRWWHCCLRLWSAFSRWA
jgi:hypothetical protein